MKQRTDFYEMIEEQYANMGKVKRNESDNTKRTEKQTYKLEIEPFKAEEKIHAFLCLALWILSYFC